MTAGQFTRSRTLFLSSFLSFAALSTIACASGETDSADNLEHNKHIVRSFLENVFVLGRVENVDDYLGPYYIQHNPRVPDGKEIIVEALSKRGPLKDEALQIKRIVAEGDLVFVHSHATFFAKPRGAAVVDIFRIEDGKIVEHWDVIQPVPENSANDNGMF